MTAGRDPLGSARPGARHVLGLLAVVAAVAYSWILEIPVAYFRLANYLPLGAGAARARASAAASTGGIRRQGRGAP